MEIYLLVLEGAHQGRRITLPPTQFIIGRDSECHLRPASADVSRFHCAIARLDQQVLIRDLKSRNGTYLNDQRLTETAKINDGDILRIGPLKFQLHVNLGPGPVGDRDSSQSWLVRSPNKEEKEALDPSQETFFSYTPPESALEEVPSSRRKSEQPGRRESAVAGTFLREYLNRRKQSTDK
jgi:pSer/pThr/pTyr-binding forkhead associated (FHA) protein